jgi:hypothetical protein
MSLIEFNNDYVKLLDYLKTNFPQQNKIVAKSYLKYKKYENRYEFISMYLDLVEPHIELICDNNEIMFSPDYLKTSTTLNLLPSIDFMLFWREDPSMDIKNEIFKKLQNLYIMSTELVPTHSISKYNYLKSLLLDSLQVDAEIEKESIREEEQQRLENQRIKQESEEQFGKLFGEDNSITKLTKEIFSELSFTQNLDNKNNNDPTQIINTLFGNNGKNIQEMIKVIGSKIETKLGDNEETIAQFQEDAVKVQKNMLNEFPETQTILNTLQNINMSDLSSSELTELQTKLNEQFKVEGMSENEVDKLKDYQHQILNSLQTNEINSV